MKYLASHWLADMITLLTVYLAINDAAIENEEQS
jgi:hypothetical protein